MVMIKLRYLEKYFSDRNKFELSLKYDSKELVNKITNIL